MPAPDKATEIKALIAAVIAFFTALWGYLGWAILLFILSMALDYVTGTWAAKAHGEWSSAVAREGLWHKRGEIVALLVAALADIAIDVILKSGASSLIGSFEYDNYLTMLVCVWYIFTEIGSILENAKKLGAPIPDWLITGVGKLKSKTDTAQGASQVASEVVSSVDSYVGKHSKKPESAPPEPQDASQEDAEEEDDEEPPN